ncbi:hypothetical protein P9743_07510, partial [Anoxybacillus geothermalis]|nr:hypothetical protein [Anoxybacillus geothermalis]
GNVFDFFLFLSKGSWRPSMVIGDFQSFHSVSALFLREVPRSSITGVEATYTDVNVSMCIYPENTRTPKCVKL